MDKAKIYIAFLYPESIKWIKTLVASLYVTVPSSRVKNGICCVQ